MTNTIKFSQFSVANLNDSSTQVVGLATGVNIRTPKVVTWTTATRPSPLSLFNNGLLGFNTDLQQYEYWDGVSNQWVQLASSVNLTATFILETPSGALPNSFALSTLSTGILKNHTGTGVPTISAPLTSIDSLSTAANEILYTTGANTYAVTSLSTFSRGLLADTTALAWRTDLGVPGLPVTVSQGGTGDTSFTAFSVITGGTTSTAPLQNVSGVGVLGQVLTSNGAGSLPTWQNSASSGIVNPGLINELAYYAANGSAVSGLATGNNGVLVTDNSGVPSISSTLPLAVQTNITELGTINTGIWNGSIIGLPYGGTNANLTASNGSVVYSSATALALSAVGTTGQLLQSNGAAAPTWTTATFPSSVGTAGTILRSDGTNWVASTATFANTYTASNILYSNGSNNIVGLVTGNNGVLITSAGGVPSISSTLPLAVQTNITELGTITLGVWNGTAVDVAHGGTGDSSFTAYSVICAGTTSTGNFQNVVGVGSIGQVLTSQGAGTLPTWVNAPGTGTINSGLINQLAYYAAAGTTVSGLATANDGLLVTSNSGVPSILAGPGSTGNILQSNSAAAPSFSTATYPSTATSTGTILRANGTNWVPSTSTFADTYSINTILYNASANTVSGLATANNGLLVTSTAGVPSILAGPGTTGNILQSNAAAAPSFSTATFPATAGTSGTILRSNGTNWVNSTSTFADTYGINTLLYASGANAVTGLATSASAVLTTVASVPTWAATLSLALGGTNAALTANNGGIFYSTASAGAILAGTATAGLALLSGASTTPAWSASPPITRVVKQLLTAASGTYTPTTGMVYCIVEMVGGGGGGGGITGTVGQGSVSAGGGSGSYTRSILTAATIGASKPFVCGAGGAAGAAANGNGGNGGDTTLGTTIVVAKGGGGGNGGTAGTGGVGGVPGTGDLALYGNPGGNSISNGIITIGPIAGPGGNSMFGPGGQPPVTAATSAGNIALGYGGGGSGANAYNSNSSFAGGAGLIGAIFITEFISV